MQHTKKKNFEHSFKSSKLCTTYKESSCNFLRGEFNVKLDGLSNQRLNSVYYEVEMKINHTALSLHS